MASDIEGHPTFAVVWSFFNKFSKHLEIDEVMMADLSKWLLPSSNECLHLVDLMVKLMRKTGMRVDKQRWQKHLAKVAAKHDIALAAELQTSGFYHLAPLKKLLILKVLCEMQFDDNMKFKTVINAEESDQQRIKPLGRDQDGLLYWHQEDSDMNVRVYVEDEDEDDDTGWKVVCRNKEDIGNLITQLTDEPVVKKSVESDSEEENLIESKFQKFLKSQCTTDDGEDKPTQSSENVDTASFDPACSDKQTDTSSPVCPKSLEEKNAAQNVKAEPEGNELALQERTKELQKCYIAAEEKSQEVKKEFKEEPKGELLEKAKAPTCEDAPAPVENEDSKLKSSLALVGNQGEKMEVDTKEGLSDKLSLEVEDASFTNVPQSVKEEDEDWQKLPPDPEMTNAAKGTGAERKYVDKDEEPALAASASNAAGSTTNPELETRNPGKLSATGDIGKPELETGRKDGSRGVTPTKTDTALERKCAVDTSQGVQYAMPENISTEVVVASDVKTGTAVEHKPSVDPIDEEVPSDTSVKQSVEHDVKRAVEKEHHTENLEKGTNIPGTDESQAESTAHAGSMKTAVTLPASDVTKSTQNLANEPGSGDGIPQQHGTNASNEEVVGRSKVNECATESHMVPTEDNGAENGQKVEECVSESDKRRTPTVHEKVSDSPTVPVDKILADSAALDQTAESEKSTVTPSNETLPHQHCAGVSVIKLNIANQQIQPAMLQHKEGEARRASEKVISTCGTVVPLDDACASIMQASNIRGSTSAELLPEKLPRKIDTSVAGHECRAFKLSASSLETAKSPHNDSKATQNKDGNTSPDKSRVSDEKTRKISENAAGTQNNALPKNVSGAQEKPPGNGSEHARKKDCNVSLQKPKVVADVETRKVSENVADIAEKQALETNVASDTKKAPENDSQHAQKKDGNTYPEKLTVCDVGADEVTHKTLENITSIGESEMLKKNFAGGAEKTEKDSKSTRKRDGNASENPDVGTVQVTCEALENVDATDENACEPKCEDKISPPEKQKGSDVGTEEAAPKIAVIGPGAHLQNASRCSHHDDTISSPDKATPASLEKTADIEENTQNKPKVSVGDVRASNEILETQEQVSTEQETTPDAMGGVTGTSEESSQNDSKCIQREDNNSSPEKQEVLDAGAVESTLDTTDNGAVAAEKIHQTEHAKDENGSIVASKPSDGETHCNKNTSSILHEDMKDSKPCDVMSSVSTTTVLPQTVPSEYSSNAVNDDKMGESGKIATNTLMAVDAAHTDTSKPISTELHSISTKQDADVSNTVLSHEQDASLSPTVPNEKKTELPGQTCNKTSSEEKDNSSLSPAQSIHVTERTAENSTTNTHISDLKTSESNVELKSGKVGEDENSAATSGVTETNNAHNHQSNAAENSMQLGEVEEALQENAKGKTNCMDLIQDPTKNEERRGIPVKENGLDHGKSGDEGQAEGEVETKAPQAKRGRKKKRRSFYNRRKSRPTVKKKPEDSETQAPKRKKPKMSVLERLKADADAIIHNKAGKKKTSPPAGEEAYRTRSGRRVKSAKKDEPGVWQTLGDDAAETKQKKDSDDEDFLYTEQKSRSGQSASKEPPAKEYKRIVDDDTPCMKCELSSHPETILLCDGCNKGHHMACLTPPLMIVPDADWFCPKCSQKKLIQSLKEIYDQLGTKLKLQERKTRQSEYKKLLDEYTGISLTNIIENSKPSKPKPQPKKKKWSSPSESEDDDLLSVEEYSSPSSPEIKTRRCRTKVSYDFSSFDKTIMDAIKDDIAIKPEVQESRPISGKDIRTIIAAEKGEDVELDTKEILPGRRKKRKLTNLNSSESEAADSGSDYSVSSSNEEMSDEEFQEPEESESDSLSDDVGRRRRLRGKKHPLVLPVKRSRRLRKKRIQEDYETSLSESSTDYEEQAPKSKKKKKRNGYGRDSSGDSDEYVPPRIVRDRHFIADDDEEETASRKTKRRRVMNSSSDEDAAAKDKQGPKKSAEANKDGDSSNDWSSLSSGAGSSDRGSASEAESTTEGHQITLSTAAEDSKGTGM